MEEAPGVFAPFADAERMRQDLQKKGALRTDLRPKKSGNGIWFPLLSGEGELISFDVRSTRPKSFMDNVQLTELEQALARRAFEQLGDIAILKIHAKLMHKATEIGEALLDFLPSCRAVFHDNGVTGVFRTRDLVLIAGEGSAETTVLENGHRLRVDVTKAYFSPRLADERTRLVSLATPTDRWIDLFGGVGPLVAQLPCEAVCVDLNPDAIALAKQNAPDAALHCGDAREVGLALAPGDHVVMNLPHLAKEFIDVGTACTKPGGTLHHHEIMPDADLEARKAALLSEIAGLGRSARIAHVRHVRNYSHTDSHYAIDLEIA